MADTRGVFGLRLTGSLKSKGEWVPLPEVWHGSPTKRFTDGATETPDTGYIGGGAPSTKSIVDKISFSSDTTARIPGANLSAARYNLAACSSFTAGYFGGGAPGPKTTVDKLTYSSDTTAYTPSANLNTPIASHAAIGNGALGVGYFAGGTPSTRSQVYKITFSNDTNINLQTGCQLTESKYGLGAVSSPTNAYFAGGHVSNYATSVDKIEYASNTVERIPGANLDTSRAYFGASSSSTAGYFSGGTSPSRSNTEKLTFSTETNALLPASSNLASGSRNSMGSTGNLSSGYFCGGSPSSKSLVDKLSYSDETQTRIPGANLSSSRYALAGTGARTHPNFPTPPTPTPSTTIFKTSPRTGYFGGGKSPSTPYMSAMNKIDFTTDAMSLVPGAKLTVGRRALFAASSKTAGYFTGGDYPNRSSFDKLTYSTDTTAALPSDADLSAARYGGAGVGNEDKGYFGGGYGSSPGMSTMDKITYSNDTSAYVPGANLSVANMNLAAAGNKDVGYFAGGYTPSGARTTLDKTTYASDTTAYTPTGNLSGARYFHAGVANLSAAYFSGGISGSPFYSNTDKITFSNDTKADVPSADLPASKARMGATADRTASYYVGGSNDSPSPARITNVSKMTFSTETMEALPSSSEIGTQTNLMAGVAARQVDLGLPNIL